MENALFILSPKHLMQLLCFLRFESIVVIVLFVCNVLKHCIESVSPPELLHCFSIVQQ